MFATCFRKNHELRIIAISPAIISLIAFIVSVTSTAYAEVKPHQLFTDNAVLQQEMPVPIWGTASDGEQVTVEFQNQKVTTTAANGAWKVMLKPLTAGESFPLVISGPSNSVTVKNVAVGEVWVISGQSNMASGLADTENGKEVMEKATDSQMRFFVVPIARSEKVARDLPAVAIWRPVSDAYFANLCSAVGFYMARDLRAARKVPVGVIQTVFGGSIAEAWIPKQYLVDDPTFKPIFARYDLYTQQYQTALAEYQKNEPELKKQYEEALAKATAAGTKPPAAPKPPIDPAVNGKVQRDRPYGLYNAMLAPLQPYAIRGVAWYQGESSAGRDIEYRPLLITLIRAWRETWGQGDFPFLVVQIPGYGKILTEPANSETAELRNGELLASQALPNVGLAVAIDTVDEKDAMNLHPPRKEPIGVRLALAARALAYMEKIVYSGPIYDSMKIDAQKPDRVVLSFKHLGSGLMAKGGELKGFTIAGEDKKFYNATAEIQGENVVVWSPQVPKPVGVRYAWADFPIATLFNKEGLPASVFRTDDFPLIKSAKSGK